MITQGLSRLLAAFAAVAMVLTAAPPQAREPAPKRPNILIVMTDDVGFAAASTFGGAIPTPALDAIAAEGLVYTNFHTTGLCSPSRAALLTGRNHHAVEFGTVTDLARPVPGYTGILPAESATLAQVLRAAGYDTAMLGKNHNVPSWQNGPLGPFDQWASGLGFDYFYGFHGGYTDQFAPQLIENTRMIETPNDPDYVLDRDMADKAIGWLRQQRSQHADQPFLLYLAPGTAHAPVQAPADWIAKFKGKFDSGWDSYREETFARQKAMGIIPQDTQLAPMPDGVPEWSSLTPDQRKIAARHMEAYAGMLAFFDHQFARIMAELKASGQYDNTLVLFIQGDKGATVEGGAQGVFNYAAKLVPGNTPEEEEAHALAHLDELGGSASFPAAPVGWMAALNTPFPYYKTVAPRLGGTRNPLVVSWPSRLKERGVRRQFAALNDIMPTVLELAGVEQPESFDGVTQHPFDGTSFAHTLSAPDAPTHHHTQYFEIFGHAAIYHKGWMLAERLTGDKRMGGAVPDTTAKWRLYDLTRDFAQTQDLAESHPDVVARMQALWEAEAKRNKVLPLFIGNLAAMLPGNRPEPLSEPGSHVLYPSDSRMPEGVFPNITNRSWSMTAKLAVPEGGASGVLVTQGGYFSGWALTMVDGVPQFFYRTSDREDALVTLAAEAPLAAGSHSVGIAFSVDGPGFGRGGNFVLTVDGEPVAQGRTGQTVPFKFNGEDGVVGYDSGTAVSTAYKLPARFTGTIDRVDVELGPVQPPQRRDN